MIDINEGVLRAPGGLAAAKVVHPTLAELIDRYTDTSLKGIGRTKAQVLRSIKGYHIAHMRCSEIKSPDLVVLASELASQRKPQPVANYLSHLGAVFAIAKPAWGYSLDQQAVKDAFAVTKRLGVTSKSRERDPRPSLPQLDCLLEHFTEKRIRCPSSAPMPNLIAFALFSTRRMEEITLWRDARPRRGRRPAAPTRRSQCRSWRFVGQHSRREPGEEGLMQDQVDTDSEGLQRDQERSGKGDRDAGIKASTHRRAR